MSYCRQFAPEIEALAAIWSTSAATTDVWTPTGKKWGTNSKPIEVTNQNNQRGVAKPGETIGDRCLRAAHEKIVSDLAYVLGLPVPPVTLWDRGETIAGDGRNCAVSAWAFAKPIEWQHFRAKLTPAQTEMASQAAGAMRVFDTWIAASDRKADHVLVSDDGDSAVLKLAYIDYSFALSYEWVGPARPGADPRPAWPDGVPVANAASQEVLSGIERLDESQIAEIVNRIPAGCFVDGARDAIIKGLFERRSLLKGWLGLPGE
jgi:hypothetical protein